MHMALGHPCIMLWWGGYSERRIVISDSCGGLYSRAGVGGRLPCTPAGVETTATWNQCIVGDSTGKRHSGGLDRRDAHRSSHLLERGRVSQVGESEVGDEVARGTAAARTARQNNRVDRFRLDTGIFDRTNRSFQCEFESALLCATSVGSLADTNYARSVSQISKLRHFNPSQLPRPECRRGHAHIPSRIPANHAANRRCSFL